MPPESDPNTPTNRAAELLARGEATGLYEQFKQFYRGETTLDEWYSYPEISGFLARGALVQLWRDQRQAQRHLLAVGDITTGKIETAELAAVQELSRHQLDTDGMQRHFCDFEPPSALLRDFSVLYGRAELAGATYDIYASADHIHLTDTATNIRERVGDYIELDNEIYQIRRKLAKKVLNNETTSIYKYI